LYRFTTYLGSKIQTLAVTDDEVAWKLLGKPLSDPASEFAAYELTILAERGQGGLLSSPELDGMTPRILESMSATIEVKLIGLDKNMDPKHMIYQGKGACGGLEVAGSISEIVDQEPDQTI
jgi:hypothetical protein